MTSLASRPAPPPAAAPLDPAERRARTIGQSALGLVGLGGVLLIGRAAGVHAPACPFRSLTGVPCPGCGMTRLADAVAHGRIGEAASADLAGVGLLAVLAVVAATYLVQVVIRKHEPPGWMRSPLLVVGIVALLVAHWATTILTGTLPSN